MAKKKKLKEIKFPMEYNPQLAKYEMKLPNHNPNEGLIIKNKKQTWLYIALLIFVLLATLFLIL